MPVLFGSTPQLIKSLEGSGPSYLPDRPRRRTSGSTFVTSKTIFGSLAGGGTSGPTTEVGRRTFSAFRVTDDFVPDKFFSRRRRGEIFNLPYKSSLVTTAFPTGPYVMQTAGGDVWTYTGTDMFSWWNRLGPDENLETETPLSSVFDAPDVSGIKTDEALRDLATVSARANVLKADTLALVTLAELSKTRKMITNLAVDLSKAAMLLTRGASKSDVLRSLNSKRHYKDRHVNWSKHSKTASSRWLEVRYGWMPLFYDVLGTLNALSGDYRRLNTARGFANDSVSSTTSKSAGSSGYWGFDYDETIMLEKRFRAYILYEADLSGYRSQKLGLLQLPASLYEIVPWSFVLDWFINLGDWLDAMSPRIGVKIVASGYTVSKVYSCVRQVTGFNPGILVSATGVVGSYDTISIRTKSRVPFLPVLPLPRVDVKINWKRTVDAIALLRQQARHL